MVCDICRLPACEGAPAWSKTRQDFFQLRRSGLPMRDAAHALGWDIATPEQYRSRCAAFRVADDGAWDDWRLALVRKGTDLESMTVAQAHKLLAKFWLDWRDPASDVNVSFLPPPADEDIYDDYRGDPP